ncbi:MAG TPA: hypothetical protein VE890_04825, partial [Thermoguttaceae bacterium]|nr:hypothetical protein [Thermoguttaceae bacterium]
DRFPEIEVVVYTHCGNDLEENVAPNFRYPAVAPVVARDEETGQFCEVDVPYLTVEEGESFMKWQRPPQPAPRPETKVEWLQKHSALCYRLGIALQRLRAESYPPLDPYSVDDMVPPEDHYRWRSWSVDHEGYAAMQWTLAQMQQVCEERGVELVATSVTCGLDRDIEDPWRFAKECKTAGVRFVSLEEALRDDLPSYMCRRVNGELELHFGALGTATYATVLGPVIEQFLLARHGSQEVSNQQETTDQQREEEQR